MAANIEITKWLSCEIDISDSTTTSDELNLKGQFEHLLIEFPALDASASITIQGSRTAAGTFKNVHYIDGDGSDAKLISDSGAGSIFWMVPIFGLQYIKLVASDAQTADVTFYIRGIDRMWENRG